MLYDVIIIGAGPGGLACAAAAAEHGLTTLVLERKQTVGRKVCAGGVTWNGLVKQLPSAVFEKKFAKQHIVTRYQKVCLTSSTPIIATVDRENLGQALTQKAQDAGAKILFGCQVKSIDSSSIFCESKISGKQMRYSFRFLVGADGSSSLVRRYLGLPVADIGIGINFQIPGDYPEMQWHLDSSLFANGYAWIFPHKCTASIGAYVDARNMKANTLKTNLLSWGDQHGYPLRQYKASAELINFDFRGWHFNNIFLIGDAAGLASGLTGEGIFPAIISGEVVGHYIANPQYCLTPLQNLIKNHGRHSKIVNFTGKNRILATVLSEITTLCLKTNIIGFRHIEMAR